MENRYKKKTGKLAKESMKNAVVVMISKKMRKRYLAW